MLIVGGDPQVWCPPTADCEAPDFLPLSEGMRLDPGSGKWTAMQPAPIPIPQSTATAVLGRDVYFLVQPFAFNAQDEDGFFRYRPAGDTWTELAPPPNSDVQYRLVTLNNQVVAYSPTDEVGEIPDMIFDPSSEMWSELPPDPLSPSFDRTLVDAGGEVILLAKPLVQNPGSESPSLAKVAKLDVAAGEWTEIDEAEVLGTDLGYTFDTLVVLPYSGQADGGQTNNWGRSYPYGGIYDAASGTWNELPDPATEGSISVAGVIAGDDSVAHTHSGSVLNLDAGSWIELPELPDASDDVLGRTVVAAGDQIVVFGGER